MSLIMSKIPILIYHAIDADNEQVTVKGKGELIYIVTLEEFEQQMQYLSDKDYHVLSLEDYVFSITRHHRNMMHADMPER